MSSELGVQPAAVEEPIVERRTLRWKPLLIWGGLLGVLAMLGLGLIRETQGPVGVGQKAPTFTLTTFDGAKIDTADLAGDVVVVNFWASWCKPCEHEAVDIEREALAYLDRFDITYPNGPDLGTRVSQSFRTRGVPETFVIGPDGRIVAFKKGPYVSLAEIVEHVELALGS